MEHILSRLSKKKVNGITVELSLAELEKKIDFDANNEAFGEDCEKLANTGDNQKELQSGEEIFFETHYQNQENGSANSKPISKDKQNDEKEQLSKGLAIDGLKPEGADKEQEEQGYAIHNEKPPNLVVNLKQMVDKACQFPEPISHPNDEIEVKIEDDIDERSNEVDNNFCIDCLYFTMKFCDCTIM